MNGLVFGPMILENAPDIGYKRDQPDVAHENGALVKAIPKMESQAFHIASIAQSQHGQGKQVRGNYKKPKRHSQGQGKAQAHLPAG